MYIHIWQKTSKHQKQLLSAAAYSSSVKQDVSFLAMKVLQLMDQLKKSICLRNFAAKGQKRTQSTVKNISGRSNCIDTKFWHHVHEAGILISRWRHYITSLGNEAIGISAFILRISHISSCYVDVKNYYCWHIKHKVIMHNIIFLHQ